VVAADDEEVVEPAELGYPAAVVAGDSDGQQVAAARLVQPGDQVVRVAARGDGDGDVVGAAERDQLAGKGLIEAHAVADRGDRRRGVVEAARGPAAAECVRGEVLGIGRRAAVAEGDQVPARLESGTDRLCAPRDSARIDRRAQLDHVLRLAPGRTL